MNDNELSQENPGKNVSQSQDEETDDVPDIFWKRYEELKQVEHIPDEEFIKLALAEKDEDKYWSFVGTLQLRGTSEVFEAAQRLTQSKLPKERTLGADILAQLGVPNIQFRDQSVEVLCELLENEQDSKVLQSIASAFGHLREVKALAKLKNSLDPNVRYAVVKALFTNEDALAVKTLIELSQDEDDEVRDWATFGLGTQIDLDTPEVREALLARATDENDEVRGEALVGLAVRRDKRVVEPLLKELTSGSVGKLAVEAARDIGDPKLYPALVALKEWWDVDEELLEEALEATSAKINAV